MSTGGNHVSTIQIAADSPEATLRLPTGLAKSVPLFEIIWIAQWLRIAPVCKFTRDDADCDCRRLLCRSASPNLISRMPSILLGPPRRFLPDAVPIAPSSGP